MTAQERIAQSRQCLRAAMLPVPALSQVNAPSRAGAWVNRLVGVPAIGVVVDALRAWWLQHPLRPMAHVVGDASNAVARPLAQRNPIVLVAGAAAVGAALVWSRPWRWVFRSALFSGLLPQLAARVVATVPIDSWLSAMTGARSPSSTRAGLAHTDAPSPVPTA